MSSQWDATKAAPQAVAGEPSASQAGAGEDATPDRREARRLERVARRAARQNANGDAVDRRAQRRLKRELRASAPGRSDEATEQDSGGTRVWKTKFANLSFYNAFPDRLEMPWIEETPRRFTTIRDAFVSEKSIYRPEGAEAPGDPRYHAGAIYDSGGYLLPEYVEMARRTERDGGRVRNPLVVSADRKNAAEFVPGKCLYLGDLSGHFGHFLLETLARAWGTVETDPDTRIILHHRSPTVEFEGFIGAVFGALGISPERLVTTDRDLRVEELLVPNMQFWITWRASSGMCVAFDHMREVFTRKGTVGAEFPRRLYLTRRRMTDSVQERIADNSVNERKLHGLHRRMTRNEDEIEQLFAARGFEIVAPETLPFQQQVQMISSATHVAGFTGSALHMILFNNRPATKLIALHLRNSFNQLLIDGIRGLDAHHIYCLAERDSSGSPTADLDVVARALDEIV